MAELRVHAPPAQQGPEREDEDTGPHDRSGREAQGTRASEQTARMQQQQRSKGGRAAEYDGEQPVEWQPADEPRPGDELCQDPLADILGNERWRPVDGCVVESGEA